MHSDDAVKERWKASCKNLSSLLPLRKENCISGGTLIIDATSTQPNYKDAPTDCKTGLRQDVVETLIEVDVKISFKPKGLHKKSSN